MSALLNWFNIQDPFDRWLVAFGLLGQAVFFMRWIIQWVATERRRESHVPELFWWFSLVGAVMLLVYFVMKRELVGVLGQLVGWTVYARNLYLIRVRHRGLADESPPSDYRSGGAAPPGAEKSAQDRSDRLE